MGDGSKTKKITFGAAVIAAGAQRGQDPHANSQAYLHYTLGRLMEVSGAHSDALVQYRRAEALDPDHCEVSNAVARTLYALGRLDDAGRTLGLQ